MQLKLPGPVTGRAEGSPPVLSQESGVESALRSPPLPLLMSQSEEVVLCYVFANLFNGFSYLCFCVQSVLINNVYEDILDSPRHVIVKGRNISKSLFRRLWIFLFDTTPKLDKQ